jgi:RNA polymerase sigma-70 factor (ECF subfamily)
VAHLALIESAVQDAGLRALEKWRGHAETDVGASSKELERWLLRVAHNLVIDALRREKRSVPMSEEYGGFVEPPAPELDDELRLIFLCCHPDLSRAAQMAALDAYDNEPRRA